MARHPLGHLNGGFMIFVWVHEFHPDKQLCWRWGWTTVPWITRPSLYPYTTVLLYNLYTVAVTQFSNARPHLFGAFSWILHFICDDISNRCLLGPSFWQHQSGIKHGCVLSRSRLLTSQRCGLSCQRSLVRTPTLAAFIQLTKILLRKWMIPRSW